MYSIMVLLEVESFGFNVVLSSLLGQSFFFPGESGLRAQSRAVGTARALPGMVHMNILKYKGIKLTHF